MKKSLITLSTGLALAATLLIGTGCQTRGDGNRTAGRLLDDSIATTRVETALQDAPTYKFEDVKVSTYRGVVQLSGWVNSAEQKEAAERIARNVQGISDVINSIATTEAASKKVPEAQGGVQ